MTLPHGLVYGKIRIVHTGNIWTIGQLLWGTAVKLIQTTLLGASLLAGAYTSVASAADIYAHGGGLKDEPTTYVPAISWTGFYIGLNGGYAWSAKSAELGLDGFAFEECDGDFCGSAAKSIDSKGGFGGVQLGYNRQSGALVYGLEADFQGAGIHGKGSVAFGDGEDENFSASAKTDLKWFGTVRGRLGYAVDTTMLYATGGFAFGKVSDKLTATFDEGEPVSTTVSKSDTVTGYVLGAGIEHKLTPNWSVKAEYDYINLGTTNLGADASADGGDDHSIADYKSDNTYHTVRIGVNYSFGAGEESLK